jgi:HlyD family type I secretion membrane fusion protein
MKKEFLNLITKFFEHLPFLSKTSIKFGFFLSLLFLGIFFVWGIFAPLNSAAVTQGTIVLSTKTKKMQHLEGGIIEKILVKEGDLVEKGQDLIVLDTTSSSANLELLHNQLKAAIANQIRLLAEEKDLEKLEFYDPIFKNEKDSQAKKIIKTQIKLFNSRLESFKYRLTILNKKIEQLKEQIIGFEFQKQAANEKHKLLREEERLVDIMVHNGHEIKSRLLNLQRQIAEIKGSIGSLIARIAEIKQAINQIELEILDLDKQRKKEISQELKDTEIKINDLRARIISAQDLLNRRTIKSEYKGVVTNLKFFAKGDTIPPHTEIMTIVPQNEKLIIEAKLSLQDIDVVNVGLKAKIKLSAYKTRYSPNLFGKVIYVSPDQIIDPVTRAPYYMIRIEVDDLDENNKYIFNKKEFQFYPGMPTEVYIVIGKRTFFGYLLDPIKNTFRRSFKED